MKKITELTPEQTKYLPVFRAEVLKKALSTERVNKERATNAINHLYEVNNFKIPQIIFCQSPYEMVIEREKIRNNGKIPEKINIPSFWFSGGWDNYWLAFYQFGAYLGVKYTNKHLLDAYQAFCDEVNVSLIYEEYAFVSDRPVHYKYDAQMRLHCLDDFVVKYSDGFGWCAWKGFAIPDRFIFEREKINPKMILAETNAEFRRVLIDIYGTLHGPLKLFKDMNAKLIDKDEAAGQPRKLYDINGARYIHVVNGSLEPDGTRREFLLGVRNTTATCHDAIAESYGRPPKKYKEVVRT